MKEKYEAKDLEKMFNLKRGTIAKRFTSRYAQERWGVEKEIIEVERYYIPKEKLHLWEERKSWVGVSRELEKRRAEANK